MNSDPASLAQPADPKLPSIRAEAPRNLTEQHRSAPTAGNVPLDL